MTVPSIVGDVVAGVLVVDVVVGAEPENMAEDIDHFVDSAALEDTVGDTVEVEIVAPVVAFLVDLIVLEVEKRR